MSEGSTSLQALGIPVCCSSTTPPNSSDDILELNYVYNIFPSEVFAERLVDQLHCGDGIITINCNHLEVIRKAASERNSFPEEVAKFGQLQFIDPVYITSESTDHVEEYIQQTQLKVLLSNLWGCYALVLLPLMLIFFWWFNFDWRVILLLSLFLFYPLVMTVWLCAGSKRISATEMVIEEEDIVQMVEGRPPARLQCISAYHTAT